MNVITFIVAAAIVFQPPGDRKPDRPPKKSDTAERPVVTAHPVRVSVTSASSATFTPFRNGKEGRPQEFLQITFSVENVDRTRDLSYYSWSQPSPRYQTTPATLTADDVVDLKPAVLGFGVRPVGQKSEEVIPKGMSISDVLVFEMPSASTHSVTLSLSPGHVYFGTSEDKGVVATSPIRIRVPASMWLKTMKPIAADDDGEKKPTEPIVASDRGLKVTVAQAELGQADVETATFAAKTSESVLSIRLDLQNTSAASAIEFAGWGSKECFATAQTDDGEILRIIELGFGQRPKGEVRNTLIRPRSKTSTVLLFEKPSRLVKRITVTLPGNGFQVSGDAQFALMPLTFEIPSSMWREGFKKEDDERNKAIKKAKGKT